jgi:transcriptional regulator with XRE-family HTH domain
MAINTDLLGPQDKSEEEAFALENLVFSVQVALQRSMNKRGVSNKALAERLGMTPARVSQIFSSSGPNLTLKTIAKIAHALEDDFELIRKEDMKELSRNRNVEGFKPFLIASAPSVWREKPANKSRPCDTRLVA